MEKKVKGIRMEFYRKDGETKFRFDIPEEIEALYKKSKPEIRTSDAPSWVGMKFYYLPDMVESGAYQEKLNQFNLFDDYGQGLFRNGKMNIAWVRTVGGSGEIPVKSPASYAEVSLLVRNTVDFLKGYFEDFVRDFKLKGIVEIEIG